MGREFLEVFEEWATSYDESVTGDHPQYRDVFDGYDTILNEVAQLSKGTVLEFGLGTGNLTEKIANKNLPVIGIEPSKPMLDIAKRKLPEVELHEGDFLHFPKPEQQVDTIVSTYAFHHLTNEEKDTAIAQFYSLLTSAGRVVFADTVYENETVKQNIKEEAKEKGYFDLLQDLNREFYPLLEDLRVLFKKNGFRFEAKQRNKFVWLFIAEKIRRG